MVLEQFRLNSKLKNVVNHHPYMVISPFQPV